MGQGHACLFRVLTWSQNGTFYEQKSFAEFVAFYADYFGDVK